MRLFVAAELPGQMLDALAETSARLRSCVQGRYVGPDLFHVTLAFLGEVEGGRVPALCRLLDGACAGIAAQEAQLGELGSFGRRNCATLWQGFSDAGPLPALARAVRGELSASGFSFDDKKFLPHVTLMRKADLSAGLLAGAQTAGGTIDTVVLFQSELGEQRPVYTPLHTVQLRGCPVAI